MDQELLVDYRVEDGQKLIAELVRSGFDVTAAFWVHTPDDDLWQLYIASDSVDSNKIGDAYGILYGCLQRIATPSISISEVKLVRPSNPIARDALAIRARYRGRVPTKFKGERFGGLSIDEAYIYPTTVASMPRSEVLQTLSALIGRTGVLQPSTITFRDGTAMRAIPVGIQLQQPGSVQIVLHDFEGGRTLNVVVDEIVNVQ